LQFRFEFAGQFTNARIMNWDFRRNARDESLHRNSAFTLALQDASREFDAAQFEKDNFVGVFDRDFHEILFPRFKKREIFGSIEFQPADARAHQLHAANFKFEAAVAKYSGRRSPI